MRIPRIYSNQPLQTDVDVTLDGSAAHHLARVLRAKPGMEVTLFDGSGDEFSARVLLIERNSVTFSIGTKQPASREPALHITLIQGVSRSERMDFAIQKAVELGVTAIVPVITGRSVVRLDEKRIRKRQEHWKSVIIGACEQAGRLRIPSISEPAALGVWLESDKQDTEQTRLVLDPQAGRTLPTLEAPVDRVVLAIGPEGGFTDTELYDLRDKGFTGIRLGPRILRTETAAVAALSAVQLLWGDFGDYSPR